MTVDEFLAAFAAEIRVCAPSSEQAAELLEVASIAAHASQRMAAPLACWMGGASGLPIAELLGAAQRAATDPDAA